MKEYPIFKHLIQFSNLVDAQGNFLEGTDADYMHKQEHKKSEERSEDDDDNEGGAAEDFAYEGGDS